MSTEATPALDEFRAQYDVDDNHWWVIDCGHHQNLFEEACDRLDAADARAKAAETQVAAVVAAIDVHYRGGERTSADYMRDAADRIEGGYPAGGSGTTAAVVRTLRAVADVSDAAGPLQPHPLNEAGEDR